MARRPFPSIRALFHALLAVPFLLGCLASDEERPERAEACSAGEVRPCIGEEGCRGEHRCLPDLAGYGACRCLPSADAGDDAEGGTTGGASGASGSSSGGAGGA